MNSSYNKTMLRQVSYTYWYVS